MNVAILVNNSALRTYHHEGTSAGKCQGYNTFWGIPIFTSDGTVGKLGKVQNKFEKYQTLDVLDFQVIGKM